jgi:hypothetical protein
MEGSRRDEVMYAASCPFCIDMNGNEYAKQGITDTEIEALRGLGQTDPGDAPALLSPRLRDHPRDNGAGKLLDAPLTNSCITRITLVT